MLCAGASVPRQGLAEDERPEERILTNTSLVREAACRGAQAIFDTAQHSLRGSLVELLREDIFTQKEWQTTPNDVDLMNYWKELATAGVYMSASVNVHKEVSIVR